MKNAAVILARSQSKGLPNKNIRPLGGKPLMAWSIEAALKSQVFDHVIVSTDSEEYAKIARSYGAEVPFLRSDEMASDTASSWDSLREVLDRYKDLFGVKFENAMLLQPTSPFRDAEDIKEAWKLLQEPGVESVIGLDELEYGLNLVGHLSEDGYLADYDVGNARRQDRIRTYHINGAIYMFKTYMLDHIDRMYGDTAKGLVMGRIHSVDINDLEDFKYAEFLLQYPGEDKESAQV